MSIRALLAAGACFLALELGARAACAASVELEGTWHVLVHFKDSAATNADEERWEDRIWVFAREGDGLRWTDYPIVVFSDEEGRFERASTNRASRVLAYWEPSAAQLAELAAGPRVNARGSRAKTLRANGAGWASKAGAAPQSATTITFSASWTVENAASLPLFRLEDALGSAMTDSLEGAILRGEYPPATFLGLKEALENELGFSAGVFMSEDAREGIKAFKEKRQPVWKNR